MSLSLASNHCSFSCQAPSGALRRFSSSEEAKAQRGEKRYAKERESERNGRLPRVDGSEEVAASQRCRETRRGGAAKMAGGPTLGKSRD